MRTSKNLFAFLALAFISSATFAADRTKNYQELSVKIATDLAGNDLWLKNRYGDYKILLVPGYATDSFGSLRGIIQNYFDDQVALYKELGLDHEIAAIDTKATVDENGTALAAIIKASTKKLLIVAHSKGSLDILDAMIKLTSTNELNNVAGFLAVQSGLAGNPLIDRLDRYGLGSVFANLMEQMGANPEAVGDMSEATRTNYLATHSAAVTKILTTVPMLTVASFKSDEPGRVDTAFEGLRNSMLRMGWPNDGLVPTHAEKFYDVDAITLAEVDHLTSFMLYSKSGPFDRKLFTRTLMTMIQR